ncbi:MAG: hypothetical protein F6K10_28275 [Moorea sp. SIO2B7]|nr:hypothetical protein [Moorena sp. SIO2B7]
MTTLKCANTNKSISLTKEIARSGEGVIWQTERQGYLAKIYPEGHHERVKKLEVMATHPPKDTNANKKTYFFYLPYVFAKR